MKKILVQINRSKWRTGGSGKYMTGDGCTKLLNYEKYKCCLGFICAIKKKKIQNYDAPDSLCFLVEQLNERSNNTYCATYCSTSLSDAAIEINDDELTTPQEKEKLLKQLFKNSIYKLEFVGSYK